VARWAKQWLIEINITKTKAILFSRKIHPSDQYPLYLGNTIIHNVTEHCHLGLFMNTKLTWTDHIDHISSTAMSRVNALKGLQYKMTRYSLETCYRSFIRPVLEYGDIIFDGAVETLKNKLENVQLAALRVITGAKQGTSNERLYIETGLVPLQRRRDIHKIIKFHSIFYGYAPQHLKTLKPNCQQNSGRYNTRRAFNVPPTRCKTEYYRKSFIPSSINLWNSLEENLKGINTKVKFAKNMKKTLRKTVPTQYYLGPRHPQIQLTQMRLNFSSLNFDLSIRKCVDTPTCPCSRGSETYNHYFIFCPRYRIQRTKLFQTIQTITGTQITASNILLFGCSDLNEEQNCQITNSVLQYIVDTKRFL